MAVTAHTASLDPCPDASVRDFLAECVRGSDGAPHASLHTLERVGHPPSSDEIAAAHQLYSSVVVRAVERFAGEPQRLTQVLLALGDYLARSLTVRIAERGELTGAETGRALHDPTRARATGQASTHRLEALSDAAREFAALSGDIEPLLTLVARRISNILGDGCAVRLLSEDGKWLEPCTAFHHPDAERREHARAVLGGERQRLGDGLAGRAAATGEAVLIPILDPSEPLSLAPAAFRPMLARIGVASALAIPLRSRGRTIGAISMLRSEPGAPYTIDDQRFAQDLADRAGLAIDNAMLIATLEQRVAARTSALELSNRELEAFSYSVSHDLRAPLRAIAGFSQLLFDDCEAALDDGGKHYLRRIIAATLRMSALIEDLLKLARITRTPLTVAVNDISAMATEAIDELRRREPWRTTAVHIAPGLTARADARLLRIALDNLLANAWKFTAKHAGAEIWFGADGGTFHVRDSGIGFDMAHADKLFAPFQRLHCAEDYEGSGIGLATVQRIVTLHGGRIWAQAEPGTGATFSFTFDAQHARAE